MMKKTVIYRINLESPDGSVNETKGLMNLQESESIMSLTQSWFLGKVRVLYIANDEINTTKLRVSFSFGLSLFRVCFSVTFFELLEIFSKVEGNLKSSKME